jgi:hypothetical protein
VLARVTGKQARLTTDAIYIARQEFVANHRPRIILRYIQGRLRTRTDINISGSRL